MRSWPPRLQQWRTQVNEVAEARTIPDELVALGCSKTKSALSPELIAAVMDRESLGGMALSPRGPAGKGDNGNGFGLMQIDFRSWPQFCNSKLWKDPLSNIYFGAAILSSGMLRFSDDVAASIAAYNCGPYKVSKLYQLRAQPSIAQLDELTTDKNYVSDVLSRIHKLQFGGEA